MLPIFMVIVDGVIVGGVIVDGVIVNGGCAVPACNPVRPIVAESKAAPSAKACQLAPKGSIMLDYACTTGLSS